MSAPRSGQGTMKKMRIRPPGGIRERLARPDASGFNTQGRDFDTQRQAILRTAPLRMREILIVWNAYAMALFMQRL